MRLDFDGPTPPVPLARFSLRWLMVGVAILAVVLWGAIELQRARARERLLEMAAIHARQEAWSRQFADEARKSYDWAMTTGGRCGPLPDPADVTREAEFLEMAAYHARLMKEYREAADRP